jgi:hypothetical protein
MLLSVESAWAGNDKRRGTAGATQLLINPWARSNGWGGVNVANVRGLDAFYSNIAGLSFINKIEATYSNTMLYGGNSGLNSGGTVNAFGLAVRMFDRGVLGLSVVTSSVGEIDITTVESPEAINGTYSPTLMNLNVAYAHSFTTSIHGGVNIKIINESTADINASGFAVDAGIQYVTGADDELKFGITLKNWGPAFYYGGNGMAFTFTNHSGNNMTGEYPAAEMELPTNLKIGLSYDFLFNSANQYLTLALAFTSNAFLKDNYAIGLEYGLLDILRLRCGYVYEPDIFDAAARTTSSTGLCAGASINVPLNKKKGDGNTSLTIDYAYRTNDNLRGTHVIGGSFRF